MNSRYLALVLIFIGMSLVFLTYQEEKISWKGFDEGKELSKKSGRYMLIYFHSETCAVCKAMDREVLSDEKIAKFIELNFIPIKVDVNLENSKIFISLFEERNKNLVVPSFVIMSPDEEVRGFKIGYIPKQDFINFIANVR